ncbi:MAG: LacI family DNA-binding transcriptional regulator [Bacteroidota bacterium]
MMKTGNITIKDIARKLGISTSTVSRAIRGVPEVSPITRKQVLELAKKWEYEPNQIAQSLVQKKTRMIGVVVPTLTDLFFSTVISGIEEMAVLSGYRVMVCNTGEDADKEIEAVNTLLNCRVDGILISLTKNTKSFAHIDRIKKRKVSLVLFDRVSEQVAATKVVVDDRMGAFTATKYLIESEHKNIAFIGGPENTNIFKQRKRGYLDALLEYGFEKNIALIASTDLSKGSGSIAIRKIAQNNPLPDAIFAASDFLAIEVIHELVKLGWQVPEQISVIGFGGTEISKLILPQLTTIEQPAFEMGKTAMRLALSQLLYDAVSYQPELVSLATQLVIRGSSMSRNIQEVECM